jgi:hypothetical protein
MSRQVATFAMVPVCVRIRTLVFCQLFAWSPYLLPDAVGGSFTFTKIADTTGLFSNLQFAEPAINDSGIVTFWALLDSGLSGIFRSDGDTTVTIADTSMLMDPETPGTEFTSFFPSPSINSSGMVSFAARRPFVAAVFVGDGVQLHAIYDSASDPPPDYNLGQTSVPDINSSGQVAFLGIDNGSGPDGLFVSNSGSIERRYDTSGPFSSVGGRGNSGIAYPAPVLNDAGQLAFLASLDEGGGGIFLGNGLTTTTIFANNMTHVALDPDINSSGIVVFPTFRFFYGTDKILMSDGVTTATVAELLDGFLSFGNAAINDNGDVAFVANTNNFMQGIFVGPNPIADKVIAAGDALFGSTVQDLILSRKGFNSLGQIAFYATLTDGSQVIAVATPTLPGDFNGDNRVDGADYVVWRKGLGTTYTQNDYIVWRSHFGQTAASGSSLNVTDASPAVPEPSSLVLLLLAVALYVLRSTRN